MIRVGWVGLDQEGRWIDPFFMVNRWLLLGETSRGIRSPVSCLELKIEHLAPDEVERPESFPTFSIVARCSLHVFRICSLYPHILHCSVEYTLSDRPHTACPWPRCPEPMRPRWIIRFCMLWGIWERGLSRVLANFPEWALEFWSCEQSPISYGLSAIINHPPCCFIIETRPFLSDDNAPSSGSLLLSEIHQYEPPLGNWQVTFLVHPASSSPSRKGRRTTNFTRRRPHSADYPYLDIISWNCT